ncbi:zinc-binding alcohol dehydrogenase [Kineococcus gynurae]|uniref:Zinc-binding alcohol dehydrogenase n=1 Tax=Kineococcus gynurae TaxID=452979 RepID=A0ABV5LUY0_9ACTN
MNPARALWTVGPGRLELRAEAVPPPGPGEVAVRALVGGISRGTEALVLRGGVPASQHALMRAPFQAGSFPFPVKYGYLSVGVVEAVGGPGEGQGEGQGEGGGGADLLGRTVFCLHPHQDRYVVPASAVLPVPDGVPPRRAALAGMVETAVNGVWDAGLGPGDRVTVVGAGVLGLAVAAIAARIPGTDVEVVDVQDRSGAVTALGARFRGPDGASGSRDAVVHTSASAAGLATGLAALGDEGTLTELSWYGDREVAVALGEAFHSRRLTVRASQVGRVPPLRAPRWDTRRRLALALDLLRADAFEALLTGATRFEDLPARLPGVLADPATLGHTVRY